MPARRICTALFAAVACATIAPASAAPPSPWSLAPQPVAPLAGVVASSPTIVVGNVVTAGSIQVHTVLRGSGIGPTLNVPPRFWGSLVQAGSETVVLFIDASGAPRWVGRAMMPRIRATSLDDAVLHLQGVSSPFDVVSPGILTLAQLKQFLATGGLDQTFDVTLGFRGASSTHGSSSRHFTVHAQGVASAKPTVSVTGLSLACLGLSDVAIPDPPGSLLVRFVDTCRPSTRSLELVGGFTGVDPTSGHVLARVEPWQPALTEREFELFARDQSIVDVRPVVSVSAVVLPWEQDAAWKSWTWRLADQSLVDPSGKTHPHAEPPIVLGPRGSTATVDFGDAAVVVTPGSISAGDPWSAYRLLLGGSQSCTFSRRGEPDVPCKLDPQAPVFVRR